MKYLINKGKPVFVTVDTQRALEWVESDGRVKIMEILWPNRESFRSEDTPNSKNPEVVKARRVGVQRGQKAFVYYQEGTRTKPGEPLNVEGFAEGRPKIVDEYETFTITEWPHIKNFRIGSQGRGIGGERTYNLPCDESDWAKKTSAVVKVESDADADYILKTFYFVHECDESGKIKFKNKYGEKVNNSPVTGSMPANMIVEDSSKIPVQSSLNKKAELTRTEDDLDKGE